MSRGKWFAGAALACWITATGAGVGFGQRVAAPPPPAPPPPTADRPAPPPDNRAAPMLRAKNVIGSKVSIQGSLAIGTVDDIIFSDDGSIDYIVVANEGKLVPVPWEAAKFDFDKRTASIEIAQERFKEIPTYTVETWPNVYEPAYREKIYTYYGVKPRREIRRERP